MLCISHEVWDLVGVLKIGRSSSINCCQQLLRVRAMNIPYNQHHLLECYLSSKHTDLFTKKRMSN